MCRLHRVKLTGPLERVLRVFLADVPARHYGYDLMKAAKLPSGTLYPDACPACRSRAWLPRNGNPSPPTAAGGRPASTTSSPATAPASPGSNSPRPPRPDGAPPRPQRGPQPGAHSDQRPARPAHRRAPSPSRLPPPPRRHPRRALPRMGSRTARHHPRPRRPRRVPALSPCAPLRPRRRPQHPPPARSWRRCPTGHPPGGDLPPPGRHLPRDRRRGRLDHPYRARRCFPRGSGIARPLAAPVYRGSPGPRRPHRGRDHQVRPLVPPPVTASATPLIPSRLSSLGLGHSGVMPVLVMLG